MTVAYLPGNAEPQPFALDGAGSWLVLVFYEGDFVPGCAEALQELATLEPAFAMQAATVVAVSTDSFWSHRAWFESHPRLANVRFPVVADTSRAARAAFRITGPSIVLVDPTGRVRDSASSPHEALSALIRLRREA
jgi:peroxiredoxin (alkyl hydroperoxide reductase subunit C)